MIKQDTAWLHLNAILSNKEGFWDLWMLSLSVFLHFLTEMNLCAAEMAFSETVLCNWMTALRCVAMRQHFLTGIVQKGKCANLGALAKISTPAVARVVRSGIRNAEECDWTLGKLISKLSRKLKRLFGNCQGWGCWDCNLPSSQANYNSCSHKEQTRCNRYLCKTVAVTQSQGRNELVTLSAPG